MQDLPDKKLKLLSILLIVAVVFGVGVFAFRELFTREIVIKEDLSEKRYYTSLLRSENLGSEWEPGEVVGVGVEEQPEISAESGLIVDINSARLFLKRIQRKK